MFLQKTSWQNTLKNTAECEAYFRGECDSQQNRNAIAHLHRVFTGTKWGYPCGISLFVVHFQRHASRTLIEWLKHHSNVLAKNFISWRSYGYVLPNSFCTGASAELLWYVEEALIQRIWYEEKDVTSKFIMNTLVFTVSCSFVNAANHNEMLKTLLVLNLGTI